MAEMSYGDVRARAALQRAEQVLRDYQADPDAEIDPYKLRNLITARDLAAARLESVLDDDRRDLAAQPSRIDRRLAGRRDEDL